MENLTCNLYYCINHIAIKYVGKNGNITTREVIRKLTSQNLLHNKPFKSLKAL